VPGGVSLAGPSFLIPGQVWHDTSDTRQFPLNSHFWHAYCFVKSQIQWFGLTCNVGAPPQFIGSTETVQTDIFASEWCGALRKNKQ